MKQGKLYFLQRADGLVKVGFTAHFDRRVSELTRSHGLLTVLRVVNGDKAREKALHNNFRKFHEFGEWFRPEAEFLQAIEFIKDGTTVDVAKEDDREWVRGELQETEQARQLLERLVRTRRQRRGLRDAASMRAVSQDYGLPWWTLSNLHSGRASTVTAHTFRRLRAALISEMEAYCEELTKELDGDLEAEAQALAARIAAKKAERRMK